ncbi:MAG TPA: Ig-like domain-containing protein [Bacilli bacterium]|nr:Ig-like domain-containing protein [Bacilli bacterium]
MKKLNIFLITILGFLLVGCKATDIDVFRFVNHEITIQVGDDAVLNLIYGEYDADDEVTYTLSKEGIIVLFRNTATGIAPGEVTVTATIDGIKKTNIIVTVINEPINSMSISSAAFVTVGTPIQLAVSVLPSHLSNEVTWSIEDSVQSDVEAATVSPSGLLSGVIGATTKAELTAGGKQIVVVATSKVDPLMSVKKTILVKYQPTTKVTLSTAGGKTTMGVTDTLQLVATILPAHACPVLTYTSSNTSVVTVSNTGLVSVPENSTNYKTTTITATSLDNVVGTIDITVLDPNA